MSETRCKHTIYGDSYRGRPCSRKTWKDGWCKQHHPDTIAEKQAASRNRMDKRAMRLRASMHVSECRDAVVSAACNFIEGEPQVVLLRNAVIAYRDAQQAKAQMVEEQSK